MASDGIDCDFRRRTSYAWSDSRSDAEDEAQAAIDAGLPASFSESIPLPFDVAGAVRFDDQAEFHAQKYLQALAARLPEVYEHTHAVHAGSFVRTPGGRIDAEHIVVATHFPFPDRSLAFARAHPQRSYAIACRIAGELPDGMFIGSGSPTRSIRAIPVDGSELLMVGGEGHRTGTGGDTEKRYAALESFAREHWDVRSVDYRWSAQDNTTVDGLPFVGPLTPFEDRVLMATGFAKWGLTGGTAAALILADRILGRENPWASLFDPNRLNARASAAKLVTRERQGRRPLRRRPRHQARPPRHRGPRARRGRHRPPPRREGRRLPRRGRHADRGLGDLHPPRLPGQLEPRRALVGLPLPRLPLRPRRHGPPGPGRPPARAQTELIYQGTVP